MKKLDQAIYNLIENGNSEISQGYIARELKVSRVTINKAIRRLKEAKVIQVKQPRAGGKFAVCSYIVHRVKPTFNNNTILTNYITKRFNINMCKAYLRKNKLASLAFNSNTNKYIHVNTIAERSEAFYLDNVLYVLQSKINTVLQIMNRKVKQLENVIANEIHFQESEFKNKVEKLRGQLKSEVSVGVDQVNKTIISEEEFQKTSNHLLDIANRQRKEIMQERQGYIDETLLGFDRKLAAVQGESPHHISIFREGLQDLTDIGKKSKDELISHYKESLKIGDELSLRCAAVAGLRLGVDEIVTDFSKRDASFLETAKARAEFETRFKSPEAKFYDLMGTYRTFEMPRIAKKPFKIGQTVEGQPYFKNRLEVK